MNLTAERVVRDVDVVPRAGLDVETFLHEALTSIARAVPFVAACASTMDPSTLLVTGTHKYGTLVGRDEHDHEFGLIEYGVPDPTSFTEMAHRAHPAVAVAAEAGDSHRLNEFMRPYFAFEDELRVIFRDSGQVWGGVSLFRGNERHFDPTEVDVLARLSDAMSVGVRNGLLNGIAQLAQVAPVGPTEIIVGRDDHVRQVSAGAEERLRDLLANDDISEPTAVIGGLVSAARRYASGDSATPPRCRVRARSGMWLVLHAAPMSPRDGTHGCCRAGHPGDRLVDAPVVVHGPGPPEVRVHQGGRAQPARADRPDLLRPVRAADGHRGRAVGVVRHLRQPLSRRGRSRDP